MESHKKRILNLDERPQQIKTLTSLTGPLTLRTMERFGSSKNSTRTWMTFPVLPVLPRTLLTLANLTG
jgi:hypothetical protein